MELEVAQKDLEQARQESEKKSEESQSQLVRYVHLKQRFEALEADEKWYREAYELGEWRRQRRSRG